MSKTIFLGDPVAISGDRLSLGVGLPAGLGGWNGGAILIGAVLKYPYISHILNRYSPLSQSSKTAFKSSHAYF